MRVMTSLDKKQYLSNFQWGQKDQWKDDFLNVLRMTEIESAFNYVYFLELLCALLV